MKIDICDKALRGLLASGEGRDRMHYDKKLRGFAVRVTKRGHVSFLLCYAVHGIERCHIIGAYKGAGGGMTVLEARTKAEELRRQVDGVKSGDAHAVDPAVRKIESAREMRFGKLAERYSEEHAAKKKSGSEDVRRLAKYVLPQWKDRKAKDIGRADVDALITPIKKHAPYEANRVLALVSVVFSFALDKGIIEHHPCLRMKSLRSKESVRERALESAHDLRCFWRVTSNKRPWSRILSKREADCLRVVMLTGARRSEIADMEWSEIDWSERLWTLPAGRSKNGQALTLPLIDPLLEILRPYREEWEQAEPEDRDQYVFQGRRGGPCDGKKVGRKLARICERLARVGVESFTIHDLRRTVETGMAAAKVPKEYRDRVLNHKDSSVGGKNYNKHDYLDEQREAMEKWARRLESKLTDTVSNVVPLRKVG